MELTPEELRERVALDILELEVRPTKEPIDRYGEPEYWGRGYRGLPVKAFQPDVRGDHCFDVIEAMQERGFACQVEPLLWSDGWLYSVQFRHRDRAKMSMPVFCSDGKDTIIRAALCTVHGL